MAVQYNKLFKLLIDLKKSPSQLSAEAGLSANIIGRLKKDEYVSMESLEKICHTLNCSVDDILDFTESPENNNDGEESL